MTVQEIIGITSGLVGIYAFYPFIKGMIKRTVPKPCRGTWWTYFFIDVLLFATSLMEGATITLALVTGYVLGAGSVAFLSLQYGVGGTSIVEKIAFVLTAIAATVTFVGYTELGLVIAVGAMFVASFPTFEKSWTEQSEDFVFWLVMTIAATGNVISINDWTSWQIVIMPISFFVIEIVVLAPLLYGRLVKSQ
jgi:hypothetical protein